MIVMFCLSKKVNNSDILYVKLWKSVGRKQETREPGEEVEPERGPHINHLLAHLECDRKNDIL